MVLVCSACPSEPADEVPSPPTRWQLAQRSRASATVAAATKPAVVQPAPAEAAGIPAKRWLKRPNILFITLDTLRYDATQLDPHSKNVTPNLAALSRRGVNFTNCYSTHDATPQSHASLFSGYLNNYGTNLDRAETAIPFQLRKLGYHSFAVVANGNLSPHSLPTMRSFESVVDLQDEWLGMSLAERMKLAPPLDARLALYDTPAIDWYRGALYGSDDNVLARLRQAWPKVKAPFFGFVNLIASHDPYTPDPALYRSGPAKEHKLRSTGPEALRTRALSAELNCPEEISDAARRAYITDRISAAGGRAWSVAVDVDPPSRQIFRMRYDGEVRELDRSVGRIFAMLRERHLLDSTIVVITSDHGESFGEADLMTHSFNDRGDRESTHHVPMLIVFPPSYGLHGITISEVCTIADVTPTLYDLLGVDANALWAMTQPGEYGHSLLASMKLKAPPVPVPVKAVAKGWQPVTPEQRKTTASEAEKRFRALGYIQ